jgi:hypothetical protein
MWLNSDRGTEILHGILKYYTFPEDIFQGSGAQVDVLRQALDSSRQMAVVSANP